MIITPLSSDTIATKWLASKKTVRICEMDLKPVPNPLAPTLPLCITKGQGTIILLHDSQDCPWLLKTFASDKRPSYEYLRSIPRCLPGIPACRPGIDRKIIDINNIDQTKSSFWDENIAQWLTGTVLIPHVTGRSWRTIAEEIHDGMTELLPDKRFDITMNLARTVDALENAQCSSRALSAHTLFIDTSATKIVDWDCVYHPSLLFDPVTICGSMGYMPSFVASSEGSSDPKRSWCPCGDRFAMAILIVEILTVNLTSPGPYDDGILFSQLQINTNIDYVIKYANKYLKPKGKTLYELFKTAVTAPAFSACPSPIQWLEALKKVLAAEPFDELDAVDLRCHRCKEIITMAAYQFKALCANRRIPLCNSCNRILHKSGKQPVL